MKRKPRPTLNDYLATISTPRYGTGQVAGILDLPLWRVQQFMDSPTYGLKPEGQTGSGYGSRRLFSFADLCRIAIAAQLVAHRFDTRLIGEVLQEIKDSDLHPGKWLGLRLAPMGTTEVKLYDSEPSRASHYYVFPIGDVVSEIPERINRFVDELATKVIAARKAKSE